MYYSYKLALGVRGILEMESTKYAVVRKTLVILHKIYPPHFIFKVTLGIALIEIATAITKYYWFNDNYTGYLSLYNINHIFLF